MTLGFGNPLKQNEKRQIGKLMMFCKQTKRRPTDDTTLDDVIEEMEKLRENLKIASRNCLVTDRQTDRPTDTPSH